MIMNVLHMRNSTMDKAQQDIDAWNKKIEMIGIDIKSLDEDMDTGRFKL